MFVNMGPPEIGINCSLEECIKLAQKTGFKGIDVDIYKARDLVGERGVEYVKGLFTENGLEIGGWIWFDDFGFEADNNTFNKYLEELPTLAKTAEAIGATRLLSWILPYSDEFNFRHNFDMHVSRIREAAKILFDYRQTLALEYIGPKTFRLGHEYPFIHDMRSAVDLIEACGYQNIGLILDSWHWYTSNETIDDIKNLSSNLAVYVHLSDAPLDIPREEQIDSKRRLPGSTGVIDNVGFLMALNEISYKGPVTAEPFSDEINALPEQEAAQTTVDAITGIMKKAGLT